MNASLAGVLKGARHADLGLVLDLGQKGFANVTGTNDADTQGKGCQVEATVHSSESSDGVLLVHEHSNIVFTASLSYAPASQKCFFYLQA